MVNAIPQFIDQPKVVNNGRDLFIEIPCQTGTHTRSLVGMGSLQMGIRIEIECFDKEE